MPSCEDIHDHPDFLQMAQATLQQDAWTEEDKLGLEAVCAKREIDTACLVHMAEGRAFLLLVNSGVPEQIAASKYMEEFSVTLSEWLDSDAYAAILKRERQDGRKLKTFIDTL